jgi:hypothetical protein
LVQQDGVVVDHKSSDILSARHYEEGKDEPLAVRLCGEQLPFTVSCQNFCISSLLTFYQRELLLSKVVFRVINAVVQFAK